MKTVTREEARKKGLTRYFIGIMCSHGHTCERTVKKNRCVECRKASLKQWRKTHPGHNNWNKEFLRKRRLKVLQRIGGVIPRCKCCGDRNIEFLTIDHKNGGGNAHRRSFGASKGTPIKFYAWAAQAPLKEVRKLLQVLCWNCNCAIGAWGYCPHKKKVRV